ncbi:MAG: hypothetical protein ACPHTD_02910, partial [Gammaproteobacteria bacterium]
MASAFGDVLVIGSVTIEILPGLAIGGVSDIGLLVRVSAVAEVEGARITLAISFGLVVHLTYRLIITGLRLVGLHQEVSAGAGHRLDK